jgi:hypothetical protein
MFTPAEDWRFGQRKLARAQEKSRRVPAFWLYQNQPAGLLAGGDGHEGAADFWDGPELNALLI